MTVSQSTVLLSFVLFFNLVACSGITNKLMATEIESKNISVDKIKQIEIDTISADIKIIPAISNNIEIKLSGKKPEGITLLDINEKGSTLEIEIDLPKKKKLSRQCKNLKLQVSLPKKVYKKLKLESVSGDINLQQVEAEQTNINSVSGDARIQEVKMNLDIETVSGDARVTEITLSKKLEFDSVSGDLNLEVSKNSGFSLKFDTVSGKIKNPLKIGNYEVKAGQGSFSLKNLDGRTQIDVETVSGDLIIATL